MEKRDALRYQIGESIMSQLQFCRFLIIDNFILTGRECWKKTEEHTGGLICVLSRGRKEGSLATEKTSFLCEVL